MSFPQILSLALLAACLVIAVWRRVNIGVLALGSCVIVLVASGADVHAMYDAFPASVFTLIAGVSLLFAHLERSGALHAFVDRAFDIIGDRTALLPWVCFAIAAALSTMGAFSTAPIALLVPAVAYVSLGSPRSFFVNEMGVVIGANAAGLSPLNPTGATVHTALAKVGVSYDTWALWAISVVTAVLAVAAIQLVERARARRGAPYLAPLAPVEEVHAGGARQVVGVGARPGGPSDAVGWSGDGPDGGLGESHERSDGSPAHALPIGPTGRSVTDRAYAIASAVTLLVFVVAIVFFGLDIGVTAMLGALILQIAFRPDEKELIARVPWNAILLLCGLLTYLGLVQQIGTMDAVQSWLTGIGRPEVLVLVIAYLTAVLCNIESSTLGVLTLMTPIVGAALGGSPALLLIIAAVAAPAALTVMNPVHVAGTLIVANTAEEQQPRAFTRLFALSLTLTAIVPGILAGIAILAM